MSAPGSGVCDDDLMSDERAGAPQTTTSKRLEVALQSPNAHRRHGKRSVGRT